MSIRDEVRASAAAHRDLGPAYDAVVAEGLVERIGDEIDKRVDARLGQLYLAPPRSCLRREPAPGRIGFGTVVLALGSMGMAIGATAAVLHPGDSSGQVSGGAAVLIALIWIVIGVINVAYARHRLLPSRRPSAGRPAGPGNVIPPSYGADMNPRRRRANAPEQRCRCPGCEALAAGANLDPEACMQAVADDIRTAGWSVSAVLGDQIAPPWAYTVGLWLSHQGPELALFGLPVQHMTVILNSIGERIANGAVAEAGDQVDGICPCALAIRPVHASWRMTSMFAVSDRYYGYVRPAYLQVVWPDRRGRYPGDPGFQSRYEGRQPMLWMPQDDHPPGVWTRLDQLG